MLYKSVVYWLDCLGCIKLLPSFDTIRGDSIHTNGVALVTPIEK